MERHNKIQEKQWQDFAWQQAMIDYQNIYVTLYLPQVQSAPCVTLAPHEETDT